MHQQATVTPDGNGEPSSAALYVKVDEVASQLSVSVSTIYRMVNAGQFPAVRVGNSIRVPASVITALHNEVMRAGGLIDISEWAAARWTTGNGAEAVA